MHSGVSVNVAWRIPSARCVFVIGTALFVAARSDLEEAELVVWAFLTDLLCPCA